MTKLWKSRPDSWLPEVKAGGKGVRHDGNDCDYRKAT